MLRPISQLSVLSKVYERVVYNQFTSYLESNYLLDKEQHGFRSGKSVVTAATDFVQSIIDSIDKKKNVAAVFLDLSRAFDSVSHQKLLNALDQLGVDKRASAWFQSYLTNRKQYVEIVENNGKQISKFKSSMQLIKYGVPQGSILGPLLFICYLKGLPSVVMPNGKICLYADDTNLLVTEDNINQLELSSFLNISLLIQNFNNKNLLVNNKKTQLMQFSTKQNTNKVTNLKILLENYELDQIDSTKFLGLIIDKNLDWTDHVNKVLSKVSSGLFALRRMSKVSNLKTLKTVYFSLIHSHINFGIILYGGTTKANLNKILKLQKQAARIMLNLKQRDSVKNAFAQLQIPTVFALYILATTVSAKESVQGSDQVTQPYNTRNARYKISQKHNLEFYKKSPVYMGLKFYNKLPEQIKLEQKLLKFKKTLSTYLTELALYSIEEFFQ